MKERPTTMTKLKPCPFCESTNVQLISSETMEGYYIVICICGAEGPMAMSEDNTKTLWNRRPKDEREG